jgi:hypothetical protein
MITFSSQPFSSPSEDWGPGPGGTTGPEGEALLAARTAAMAELAVRGLGTGRLVLLWLTGATAVVGWAALGLAVQGFQEGGPGDVTALVGSVVGVFFLGSAALALTFWVGHGRDIRRSLDAWADLGTDLVTDVRLRAQGRCVGWLLPSAALSVLGLWATVRAGERPEPVTVGEMVYALGLGATTLAAGLLGVVQAVGHQRWSERLLSAIPVRRGGGAHR